MEQSHCSSPRARIPRGMTISIFMPSALQALSDRLAARQRKNNPTGSAEIDALSSNNAKQLLVAIDLRDGDLQRGYSKASISASEVDLLTEIERERELDQNRCKVRIHFRMVLIASHRLHSQVCS